MYRRRRVFYTRCCVLYPFYLEVVVHNNALLCMGGLAFAKPAVSLLCIRSKVKANIIGKFIDKIIRRCSIFRACLNLSTCIRSTFLQNSISFLALSEKIPFLLPSHSSSSSSLQVLSLYQVSFRTLVGSHQWSRPSRPKPRGNHSGLCLFVGDFESLLGLPAKAATKAAYIGSCSVKLLPDDESVDITGLFSSLCLSCVGSMFGECGVF